MRTEKSVKACNQKIDWNFSPESENQFWNVPITKFGISSFEDFL